MSANGLVPGFTYYKFGLIVTGTGERMALEYLFRSLTEHGCHFTVIRQIGQRSPLTSKKSLPKMVNTDKKIPEKDVEQIGLPAWRFLESPATRVILIDDLEADRVDQAQAVFERYRSALDTVLSPDRRQRASVHFLVNMLEAYYFADVATTNAILRTQLIDRQADVELIRNPKGDLKGLCPTFRETKHGTEILRQLDVPHVLSNPATCSSLRALFMWCWSAMGKPNEDRFCFQEGRLSDVTRGQIGLS